MKGKRTTKVYGQFSTRIETKVIDDLNVIARSLCLSRNRLVESILTQWLESEVALDARMLRNRRTDHEVIGRALNAIGVRKE